MGGVEHPKDGVVVGLRAATGEDNFLRTGVDEGGDLFASVFYGGAGFLADGVDGGGVAEVSSEEGEHGIEDGGVRGSGGVVVEVDASVHGRCFEDSRSGVGDESVRPEPASWLGFAAVLGREFRRLWTLTKC